LKIRNSSIDSSYDKDEWRNKKKSVFDHGSGIIVNECEAELGFFFKEEAEVFRT